MVRCPGQEGAQLGRRLARGRLRYGTYGVHDRRSAYISIWIVSPSTVVLRVTGVCATYCGCSTTEGAIGVITLSMVTATVYGPDQVFSASYLSESTLCVVPAHVGTC